jgi:hypothetical protein
MKKVFVSIFVLFLLFSCQREDEKTSGNFAVLLDTTLDDFSYLEMKIDTIDSTNHRQFLDKEGNYTATWNMLIDIKVEETNFPKYDNKRGYYSEFGTSPLFLNNKQITIEGYIIPTLIDSIGSTRYFISYYPNSACFFCSGNGPETVMELNLEPNQRKLREDEYLKVRGKLILNNGNPNLLPYNLFGTTICE